MDDITVLLKLKNCYIYKNVNNWKEAVHLACKPLVLQHYCTAQYEEEVFKSIEQYGFYFVLCENLALIHVCSFENVYETQISITVLKDPVYFEEGGKKVHILICLVAKDSFSHLRGIEIIARIFEDSNKINRLLNVTQSDQIFNLFMEENLYIDKFIGEEIN